MKTPIEDFVNSPSFESYPPGKICTVYTNKGENDFQVAIVHSKNDNFTKEQRNYIKQKYGLSHSNYAHAMEVVIWPPDDIDDVCKNVN